MPVEKLNIPKSEKDQMGKVTATIMVTNDVAQVLIDRGFIEEKEVRRITLENGSGECGCLCAELTDGDSGKTRTNRLKA